MRLFRDRQSGLLRRHDGMRGYAAPGSGRDVDHARNGGCLRQPARIGFSVEVWEHDAAGNTLVGGLYGVGLGRAFFGESMFHVRPHASKLALVSLMEWLKARHCQLVDCQMATDHIMRYGAECIPRHDFLQQLRKALCRGG